MTRPFRASVDVETKGMEAVSWLSGGHETRAHIIGHNGLLDDWTACGILVPEFSSPVKPKATEVCVHCLRKLKRNGEEEK